MIQARRRQRGRARRHRRHRLGRAGQRAAVAVPAEVRHPGAVRRLRRPDRREQGVQGALRVLPGLPARGGRTAVARAHRQHAAADSRAPAHPPPGLPRRCGQVRRDGGSRSPGDAVVLREPVDGGARGVGARPPGAGQRQVRRPEGPVPAQQRRAVLRDVLGVPRDAAGDRTEPLARAGARPERPPVLPRSLRLAGHRAEVSRHVRQALEGDAGPRRSTRCPAGWSAGRRRARRPKRCSRSCRRARRSGRGTTAARAGTGDAGEAHPPGARHARLRRRHRPRGARHPARAARARATNRISSSRPPTIASSRRRATTASSSTPAIPTTCCSTISRSARGRRGRRSRCPTGWRSSTTTSRRPSTSRASTGRWPGSASTDGASSAPTRAGAISRWATRSSTGRTSRRSASRAPPSSRSSPTSRTSTARRTGSSADQFDDAWTNIVFVGRVIANKKIEDLIRFFDAYQKQFNPRSRLLIVGAHSMFERYLAALHHMVADLRLDHVHFVGHVSDEELVAYYEIADLFLCASEHEGFCVPLVEAFYKQIPVLAYAATAVPSTMDGAGRALRRQGSDRGRDPHGRDPVERRSAGRDRRGPAGSRRAAAGEGLRGHAARLRRPDPGRPARPGAAGDVRFLDPVRRGAGARGAAAVPPGGVQGAAGGIRNEGFRISNSNSQFEIRHSQFP